MTSAEATLAEKEREQQIASDRLTTAQNSLNTVKQESDASKKSASETSDSVAEIVVSTYQGDNSVTSWSYVLSSQDVEDSTDVPQLLRSVLGSRRRCSPLRRWSVLRTPIVRPGRMLPPLGSHSQDRGGHG